MSDLKRFLRADGGPILIIALAFMVAAGVVGLAMGAAGFAEELVPYTSCALIICIALQIASFLSHRESDDFPKGAARRRLYNRPHATQRSRDAVTVSILAILLISAGGILVDYQTTHGFNPLTVTVDYVNAFKEPMNATTVTIAVTASGGTLPYSYLAGWPDGQNQTSADGVFDRTFSAINLPAAVMITVKSSDGQVVTRSLSIGPASTSTASSTGGISTSTSVTSTVSSTQSSLKMKVSVSFATKITQPDGNVTLSFGMTVTGGQLPFNFVATWSDGAVQSDTTGVFSRTFADNQTLPSSAYVVVIGSDGQTINMTVSLTST